MIACPSCDFKSADTSDTCRKCGAVLHGVDPICGMPIFGGTSVGQVLDRRYVITRGIGSDGMGVVYQAEDAEQGVPVFLRALPTALANDHQQTDHLRRQAKAVLGLSHPNIVRLLGFQFDQTVKCLVTEHFAGSTLQERISAAGPLTVEQMLRMFLPLAEALDYAHSRNVLHLDINPANIILAADGSARLANFAVTRQIKDSLSQITSEQTPDASLYMAPEQFRKKKAGSLSDIYSLAATIYHSLCRPPLAWRGWLEYQVLNEQPSPLDILTDGQNAALLKALSRDSRNRPRTAQRFLDDLRAAVDSAVAIVIEPEEKAEDYADAIAQAEEKLKAETRARIKAEHLAGTEAQARAEAEEQLRGYAERIARVEKELQAEIKARIKAEKNLKAETERLTEIKAQSAQAAAAAEARIREQAESYAATMAESREQTKAEALARADAEKKLRAETEARFEAQEQVRVYTERLAQAEEKLTTESVARFQPGERTEAVSQPASASEEQARKPASKFKVIVTVFAATVITVLAALTAYQYIDREETPHQALESWMQAQLSAAQQDYEGAIRTADAVIAGFPQYAGKQGVQHIRTTWQKTLAADSLWLSTEQLAGQSNYEQAIINARRLLKEYPDTRYANQAKAKLPLWQNAVSVNGQTSALLAKARGASDANDLDAALAAVASVLELAPGNVEAGAFRAELEATRRAEQRIRQITAQKQQQLEKLKADALASQNIKDWENAISLYTKASALNPEDAEVIDALAACRHNLNLSDAQTAEAKGDLDAAVEAYAKALSFKANPSLREKLESLQSLCQAERTRREAQQSLRLASEAESKGDFPVAVEWYRKAADAGDSTAMHKLGLAYLNGNGLGADNTKALEWFHKAADAGNGESMYKLGLICQTGDGVPKDYSEALNWYHKAAKAGNPDAMHNLGGMYYSGEGIAKDNVKAMEWLAQAAVAGNTQAMYNLGVAYYNGDGVSKDYAKAVEWFRKAAEQDNASAMYNLALAYLDISDYANAEKWFAKAADVGNVEAMYNLGVIYHNGYGLTKDYAKALDWYRKAARGGDTNAMVNLGLMHHDGIGIDKDPAKAVELYRQAADAGNTRAMSNLAMAYYNGDGATKDQQKAVQLLQKAAEKGENMAMFNLGMMYQNGWSVAKDHAKAVEWYRKAADSGDAQAMYSLATVYRKGDGAAEDQKEALQWYQKAARLGHPQAKQELIKLGQTW